jgi:branched-subunit amino acid aminotransferase/4-amino-4-deoxychorismate lyase
MKSLVSFNGQVTTLEDARIPATDRGFLFGDSIFETLVAFHGKILNKDRHLSRLHRSAELIGLQIPWSNEQLSFELDHLIQSLQVPKMSLRLVVTRGSGLSLRPESGLVPNRVIFAIPAKVESDLVREEGLALQLRTQAYTERRGSAKTGNYVRSIVALNQLKDSEFDEVLWENSEHEITEAATANIFFIGRDGDQVEIATPAENSGILLGITRQTLCEFLNSKLVPVTERIIYSEEIPRFDEAFLSSTVRGLIPVKSINRHKYHTGRPNSIFRMIRRLHNAWVAQQLGFAVDWNTGAKN